MRSVILAGVLAITLAGAGLAQDADDTAIHGVIQSQVDAFQADDAAKAFTYASPLIQGMFGGSEMFGKMVQGSYPMIWKPSKVEFLGLRNEGGKQIQRMLFRDAAGGVFLFDYEMVSGPDGWKINGVFPVKQDSVGA